MSIVNMSALTASLKYLYSDLRSAVYTKSAFASLIKRDESFGGMGKYYPIIYGGMRTGNVFSDALNNRNAPSMCRFYMKDVKDLYSLGSISQKAIKGTANDRVAMATAVKTATDGALDGWARRLAVQLWGNGSGKLAQVAASGAFSTTTCTLADPNQIINFEPGMNVMISGTDGTGSLRAGGPVTITGADLSAGTLSAAVNWTTTVPAATDSDYLFAGSASGSDYGAGIHGVLGWIPTSAPSATLWFGVDRTVAPHLLAGQRFSATGGTIEEAVVEAAAYGSRAGGVFDTCFVHPTQMANVRKSYMAKGWTEITTRSLSNPEIGYKSIAFVGGDGNSIALIEEKFMPAAYALLTKLDTWELQSMGPAPFFMDGNNGQKFWPSPSDDAVDFRVMGYLDLACKSPRDSVIITL